MSSQLSLALTLRDDATFANFLAEETTRVQLKKLLFAEAEPVSHLVYLWGAPGSGVSHLTQALCHHWQSQCKTSQFLPLSELQGLEGASLLEGLEKLPLVCLEDIHCVGGNARWEQPLFNLYNQLVERENLLLVTANCAPAALPIQLPDLVSRLSSGLVFHLPPYSDEEKLAILRFRATGLGLDMAEEVAVYLLNRCSRDLDDLMALLKKLDVASLQAKRRLTIPFIKEVVGI